MSIPQSFPTGWDRRRGVENRKQMEIIDRGVMHTPAVGVNGEVKTEGEISNVDQLVGVFTTEPPFRIVVVSLPSEAHTNLSVSRIAGHERMSSQSNDYRVASETMTELKTIASESDLDTPLDIFKALADERRILIMVLLAESDLCVCDLVEIFDIEYSKLSYHLKVLKEAGLVTANRDGNYVTYRPTDCGEDVIDIIQNIC